MRDVTAMPSCHYCKALRSGAAILVDGPGVSPPYFLCDRCWLLLVLGFSEVTSGSALDAYRAGHGLRLSLTEIDELLFQGVMIVERAHHRRLLADDEARALRADLDEPPLSP
ncbi:MAG: hypothetical protein IT305_07910 [Chloroflexi bacterium]|nr:hypothetical protein [Chloroflexota bacterium]